jgi:TusA-related sulfurtransferase
MNVDTYKEKLSGDGKVVFGLPPQAVGESYVEALTARDFKALEQLFQPGVHFQGLVPSGLRNGATASEAVGWLQRWFGDKDTIDILQSGIEMVQDVLSLHYRLRVHDRYSGWQVIEQNAYAVLEDGKIAVMRLVCSGFQTIRINDRAKANDVSKAAEPDPARDELLQFHTEAADIGATCALLTPLIRSKLNEMQSGQVLEVRVDDPTARDDIEAWSRLSGNALLQVIDDQGPEQRFFVMKK